MGIAEPLWHIDHTAHLAQVLRKHFRPSDCILKLIASLLEHLLVVAYCAFKEILFIQPFNLQHPTPPGRGLLKPPHSPNYDGACPQDVALQA